MKRATLILMVAAVVMVSVLAMAANAWGDDNGGTNCEHESQATQYCHDD